MRRSKNTRPDLISATWAIVCDMRRDITGLRMTRFPKGTLTRKEEQQLAVAIQILDDAEEFVRKAQASLAERSKLAGYPDPDYETGRSVK